MDVLDTFLSGIFGGSAQAGSAPQYSAPSLDQFSPPSAPSPSAASRNAMGATEGSGPVQGLPRSPAPGGSLDMVPGQFAEMLKSAIVRQEPGGPGDMPPMARGAATAAPDAAPSVGVPPMPTSQMPGLSVGSMPRPMAGPRPGDGGTVIPSAGVAPAPVQPSPSPAVGAWSTATSAEPQGIMDILSGLKKNPTASAIVEILNGAMRGAAMNVNNPRGNGIGAFGAGYTSAQDHLSKQEKEKAAAELAKQKLGFDQTLAVRKDARAERGATRDDEKLGLSRREQDRRDEDSKVKNRAAVDKLMQARAGVLTTDAKFKLQDQVTKYLDKLNKNGLMRPEELETAAQKKIQELEAYYGVAKPSAPAQAGPPRTATGPNGQKIMLQNGQWVPVK